MRKLYAALAGVVLVLACNLNAQSASVGSFNSIPMPIQSIGDVPAQPDSIVAVAAESQGLSQIAQEDLPRGGTYWWVQPGGQAVPTPFPPPDMSQPIYQITDVQFLVDQTGGQVVMNPHRLDLRAATTSAASAAAAQANAVVNLINQVQTTTANQQMRTMIRSMGMDSLTPDGTDGSSDSGDSSPDFTSTYCIDTNGLWLEITNVSNGWSYLNIHNATNQVYSIWSTTNLATPFANWQVECELWPTNDQTNVMPFAVQNFDRQDLYFRAEDWTGVDSDGDGIPDWWIWKYFGNFNYTGSDYDTNGNTSLGHTLLYDYQNGIDPTVNLDTDNDGLPDSWELKYFGTLSFSGTNLDSGGINTLLYDYQNGYDPNVIVFTISVTNNYITTAATNLLLNVTAGTPSYYSVLVDSTNFATTNWMPYTASSLPANFSSVQGWHDVWIGLRGLPADATQTWQWKHLNLSLPPVLTITNPIGSVVSQPMIQIYGYCQESLASINYDISNAIGVDVTRLYQAS